VERGGQVQREVSAAGISEFPEGDSTTAPSFASLTVITDHGKRVQSATSAAPAGKTAAAERPSQGEQG